MGAMIRDVSKSATKPSQESSVSSNGFHDDVKVDDSNSVKVPIAIFDSIKQDSPDKVWRGMRPFHLLY